MDMQSATYLNDKCDVCSMTFYETINIGRVKICILCNTIKRCKQCNITIVQSNLDYCHECWEKTFEVSCILPDRIYLSDFHTSKNYDLLKKHGIKQILTIGKELPKHDHADFKTMYISLDDAPLEPISAHFNASHEFINQAPTLVHCYAGISRSASLVISYLMKYLNMTFREALTHCRKSRPQVNPNNGFRAQLMEYGGLLDSMSMIQYSNDLHASNSETLASYEYI